MDKRTITALLLMLALYLAFNQFVWKPQADKAKQAQTTETTTPPDTLAPAPVVTTAILPDSLSLQQAEISEEVSLENENVLIRFNSKGAVITSVVLKKFHFTKDSLVNLIPENSEIAGTSLYQNGSNLNLKTSLFQYTLDEATNTLRFFLGSPDNPTVVKSYVLDDKYGLKHKISVNNMPNVNGLRMDFSAGIADSEHSIKAKAQDYRFFLYADNEIMKVPLSKMKKTQPQGSFSSFAWAAVRSKYFTLAIFESEPPLSRSFATNVNPSTKNPGFSIDSFQKDAKNSWEQNFVLYMGPADADILKDYGKQMENIAERGAAWLRWLSNFFAWFLNWLHSYIRNYGVVIIIFSFLLKIVLHPLTHKSMDASLKMQKIQPQMQALQKKYKDDPKTLQIEMSKLYKEAGTNPLSGCLPLLLQMPIFFSLYSVLRYSLDMRNAGFVFWLKDLSEPDPYLVLPVIMGIFMVIQSLMMQPKKGNLEDMDEKQRAMASSQKMMTWMMPIMMFFVFRNMPAGLVLYWTVFNIFSVIQQYYLQKHYNKE